MSVTKIYNSITQQWEPLSFGLQGVSGLQGFQGLQGASIQGLQGLQGIKGFQGIQGTSIQGLQGIQGPSGSGGGSSLPSQTGHSGEYLTTNGTDASWQAVCLINLYN